jgi:cytochrome c oxidase subunit I+III
MLAAVFTAAFFMLLTVKLVLVAALCGLAAIAFLLVWMWGSDPAPGESADIGGGIRLPIYVSGPLSHSWWAVVVLLLVAGSLYLSYVFSYLYMWTVNPALFADRITTPAPAWPVVSAILLAASSGAVIAADRLLRSDAAAGFMIVLACGTLLLAAGTIIEPAGEWLSGKRPSHNAIDALVFTHSLLQSQIAAAVAIMAGFAIARCVCGHLDARRRVVFDNLALLWHFAVAQGLTGLVLIHGFPWVVS